MGRKLKPGRKSKRRKRRERKDAIPFGKVRKPIPRPCPDMKDKTVYNRKDENRNKDW